jgi:hypothetical protein
MFNIIFGTGTSLIVALFLMFISYYYENKSAYDRMRNDFHKVFYSRLFLTIVTAFIFATLVFAFFTGGFIFCTLLIKGASTLLSIAISMIFFIAVLPFCYMAIKDIVKIKNHKPNIISMKYKSPGGIIVNMF